MLSPSYLNFLFEGLGQVWELEELKEISFEANPATFGESKARLFKELGINRISLGIQSFDNEVLKTLGREHSRREAIESVELLQGVDFPSVNIDLMFSIPGQSREVWEETWQTAIGLRPQHISAYNLTYEEDTAFFESLKKGKYQENPDDDADFYELAKSILTEAGFEQYETSNYAFEQNYSIHNQAYWFGNDYIGLGPSAVSTIDGVRSENIPDTKRYVEQVKVLGNAMEGSESLDEQEQFIERVALELRTKRGLEERWLDRLNQDKLQSYLKAELLIHQKGFVRIHEDKNAFVDHIVSELI